MKTVYTCVYQEDAIVLRSLLHSAGIAADTLSAGQLDVNPLYNVSVSGFQVVVPDGSEDDARAVVADYVASKSREETFKASGTKARMEGATAFAGEPEPRATEHRRALHRMPEIGIDLPDTLAYVRKTLRDAGLEPHDCGPGIICDIGSTGPLVALRADMDALPVTEETGDRKSVV